MEPDSACVDPLVAPQQRGRRSAPWRWCSTTKAERAVLSFMLGVLVLRVFVVGNFRHLLLGQQDPGQEQSRFQSGLRRGGGPSSRSKKLKGLAQDTSSQAVAPIKRSTFLPGPPSRAEEIKRIEKMMFKGLTSSRKVADKKPSSRSGNEDEIGWMGKAHARNFLNSFHENGSMQLGSDAPGGGGRSTQTVFHRARPITNGIGVSPEEMAASWSIIKKIKLVAKEIPLLMNQDQFRMPGISQESPVFMSHLEYEGENETTYYTFPKGLIKLLPVSDSDWRFETCAIVGNSGVILLKDSGAEIDRHDAVFRINLAPIRGFGKWVGTKTTFNIVNAHNVKEMLLGRDKNQYIAQAGNPEHIVMFETASEEIRLHYLYPLLRKVDSAILLNPILVNRFHTIWLQLRYLLEQESLRNFNRKPMSGYFTTMFALQVCDHVNLYGFDAYQGKRKSYRYHYFDNVDGFVEVHSFDLAFEVFKMMSQQELLAIQL